MKRLFKLQRGFTLIEILIVMAILGVLVMAIVPKVTKFMETANITAADTEAASVGTSAMLYLADNGVFPATSDDLVSYLSGTPKAKYIFDTSTGLITDAIDISWAGMKWDAGKHQWEKD